MLFALQRFRTSMFTFRAIASAALQNQHVVVHVEIVWRRWPYTYACNSVLVKNNMLKQYQQWGISFLNYYICNYNFNEIYAFQNKLCW